MKLLCDKLNQMYDGNFFIKRWFLIYKSLFWPEQLWAYFDKIYKNHFGSLEDLYGRLLLYFM